MALESHGAAGLAPAGASSSRARSGPLLLLSGAWLAFQVAIVAWPQQPLIERPVHLAFALAILFFPARRQDWLWFGATVAVASYYLASATRLAERIEAVDPIAPIDVIAGAGLLLLLLEGVRRIVGWSLLALLLVTLAYDFGGRYFPGWARFSGFGLEETIEIMTMTTNGVLGVTTATSVQFVFYFLLFGAMYGAIGGGQLFIDIGVLLCGRQRGGAAKAAVISSSLMGTVSGSAVANVVSVGVFTIPLMRRAGYSPVQAGAIEAISSTGGQLMPPVMGVAAFVMAELLQIDYGRIALAAVIPAIAFYFALFMVVDLMARKNGIGTLTAGERDSVPPVLPRLHLLVPPAALVGLLATGWSATLSVIAATGACVVLALLDSSRRPSLAKWRETIEDVGRQSAQVAIPIAAIGMVVAVAVQSNLALRFSARLIEAGGQSVYAALVLTIAGCLVMGMGLPTVAAYIIGAILFAPVLVKLGLSTLGAHFFVMYYSVLSMVTPPVALASFASAGLAQAPVMETGWAAFRLGLVLFLIPFGFAFDPLLLGQGALPQVLLAFAGLLAGSAAWAAALVGHARAPMNLIERLLCGAVAVASILFPTGSAGWLASMASLVILAAWLVARRPRQGLASASAGT